MRCLIALILLLVPASAASADPVVSLDDSVLTVDGTAGRDEIELAGVPGELRISNTQGIGRTIEAGAGCRRVGDTVVGCPRSSAARGRLVLGASDDTLIVRSGAADLPLSVFGGDGGDALHGGNAGDSLFGGDGQDLLDGAGGNDALNGGDRDDTLGGGAGDDHLDGGRADDSIDGGPGTDTVDYSSRTRGVDVTLDDQADDGEDLDRPAVQPGWELSETEAAQPEKDNVRSTVENVLGGAGDDGIIGSASPNRINGLGGDDLIRGLLGDDHIIGGSGTDDLDGGGNLDLLDYSDHIVPVHAAFGSASSQLDGEGEAFVDFERILGGSGPDVLQAPSGESGRLEGGPGDDVLVNENGAVFVSRNTVFIGGPGRDTVSYAPSFDMVTASLDGVGNDGREGEEDLISGDVENLTGGFNDDLLIGNDGSNVLDGRGRNNRIEGRGGDDTLKGSGMADRLLGGPGSDAVSYAESTQPVRVSFDGVVNDGAQGENDQLLEIENAIGSAHGDELTGDAGPNRLEGGAGIDLVAGQAGDDRISTVDGEADHVSCGDGTDSALLDLPDLPDPAADCETNARAPRNEHPIIGIRALRRGEDGRARLVLGCPRYSRPYACTATLTVRRGAAVLVRRTVDLGLGRTVLRLRSLPAGRYVVQTAGADSLGRALTSTRSLLLR